MIAGLHDFAAQALVPEQNPVYVRALSDRKALACGPCIAYPGGDDLVLIGYPLHDPLDQVALDTAVDQALRLPVLQKGGTLTVISAVRPSAAPNAALREDQWWGLDLPAPPPGQKLRNMLRRAGRSVRVERGAAFAPAHETLIREQIRVRNPAPGTRALYSRVPEYLAASPSALLFEASANDAGAPCACAVAEYGGLSTAFYLFAFRSAAAPPGTADALLAAVLREAEERGHARCNLGLGIDSGIAFFKKKWGARPLLPYGEYSWTPKPSLWRKFFG